MKDPESLKQIAGLGPDLIGFIFYPKSPRYVVEALDPSVVRQIPKNVKKAGVFVDEDLAKVFEYAERYALDVIQLHGNESPDYCKKCREHFEVIKTFAISEEFDMSALESYKEVVDYFLFDTKTKKYGGSGKKFNWDLLKNYTLEIPYFLSGGIGVEDVESALEAKIPPIYCLDINSKIEMEPGKKDPVKVQQIVDKLNKYRPINNV